MRVWRWTVGCAVAALLLSGPALARECKETDTIRDCWNSFFDENDAGSANKQAEVVAEKGAADTASEVPKKATGVSSGGVSLSSTTEDFLPLLTFVGLLSESDEDAGDGVVAFDVNPPFGKNKVKGLKIRLLVATDPKVADDVKMALPEATRDAQTATLQKSLSDTDNYTVSVSWNVHKGGLGRSFRRYRDEFKMLAMAVQPTSSAQIALAAQDKLNEVVRDLQDVPGVDLSKPFNQPALTADQQLALRRATEAAAKSVVLKDKNRTQALADAGLDKFAALVANQPQLHFTGRWRSRDPLTGGDEVSAKLTFEWSRVNLKSALKDASCDRQGAAFSPATCASEYKDYLEANSDGIENGTRFSFSGEYVDVDSRTVPLTALELDPLTLPGAKKLILSVAGSRSWGQGGNNGEPVRLDLEAKYEDVSDDPMRRNRLVATLTLTKKIGGMSIPIGLVYANRSEFVTDVDERLSAHLGLKFDFLSKSDG